MDYIYISTISLYEEIYCLKLYFLKCLSFSLVNLQFTVVANNLFWWKGGGMHM